MVRHIQAGRRALAVCAPTAKTGCTFVSVNLAVALSQIGVKTLLIDGNLRRPAIGKVFKRSVAANGLQQCLTTPDVSFSEFTEPDVLPGLSVLFAGVATVNPLELLAGKRFGELVDFCLRNYDATIVDAPPADRSADAMRIGSVISYCLVVARRNRSFVNDVRVLADSLKGAGAQVIGTVFNYD